MSKVSLNRSPTEGASDLDILDEFYRHLVHKQFITGDIRAKFDAAEARRTGKPLQKLCEVAELSAHDFANEVARFFALPRVGLPELMAADSLADRFSQRFLRESAIFPYQAAAGR